jgi:catechol 2,3-dioxygenase-like lactoylglutathione lyase family enzyme
MVGATREQGEMPGDRSDLSGTVKALRPFVPAKNFDTSKRFYADLGFRIEPLGDGLAEVHLGSHSFLLQDFYVEQWAGNFMMHMLVDELEGWWAHIAALDLAARYDVENPRPPKLESWGLNVAYVFDPSGVLWHIAELPRRSPDTPRPL